MTNSKQIYKCNICGNIVEVLHAGEGELVCCGQPMKLMAENKIDAAREKSTDAKALAGKHVPIIEKTDDGVKVKVGEVTHPMDEDHYIEWIEISTDKGSSKKFLKPGDKPEVFFPVKTEKVKARAYCNLHGLWQSN